MLLKGETELTAEQFWARATDPRVVKEVEFHPACTTLILGDGTELNYYPGDRDCPDCYTAQKPSN